MEDGLGSADRASDVIKKKSSSGCLIIKKKGNGVSGFGASGSKKVFESRTEKKRPRMVLTDSGSSDELLEPVRRKVADKYYNSAVHSKKGYVEDTRTPGFESERKRSGLDVFEFDEYDGFDGKKTRKDYMDDRLNVVEHIGNHRDLETGSSRNVADRRKDIIYERKRSMSGGKSKGLNYSGKSRYEAEDDDEAHLPISFLREKCREAPGEPVRLQGRNGVLKVMVNKKKQQGLPDKGADYPRADQRISSRSEAAVKKNEVIRPTFHSDSKRIEKPVPIARMDKSNLKSRKALPVLSSKAEDSETDDSVSDKQESSEQAQRPRKAIKTEHRRATPTEILTPPRGGKESKVKRGNGTEKQLLREKIRSMLLDRGWRIDYRPRKNRDYLDAVYINPAGTAYWSIIKAYDALQKQLEEEEDNIKHSGDSTSFTPLPEEIISKLTRQTRKKIEREMKKKKRDANCSRSAKEVTRRESSNCTDSEQQEEKLSSYMKQNHKALKGRLHEADHASENDSSDTLYKGKAKQDRAEKQSATNSHMIQGRKSRKIGRCTLLVRSSHKGLNTASDGFVPYTGKRTVLSWLIDSGIVQMSEKVQYMNRRKTKVLLEGWITKDGIHCGCCSKILTISKFEIHAGSKQRHPFPNIYLESGVSLMQCQIDAWNKQEESERKDFHNVDIDGDDPNDDTCGLCGDGGDLICCDGCPSTFHQSCLDIKMLPAGDWHCPNCTCKFCGFAGRGNAKANDRTDSSLLICSLCEKKYHKSCSREKVDLSDDTGDDTGDATNSFCGKNCQEVLVHLQRLLGVKHELESGFSWSLVHRMDPTSETLHLGFSQRVECNSKLAVALSVMDECFLPIIDRRSGINLIRNVLYNCGSNFNRLNYTGFYTAILERGDEIISAASIRIHGTQLAEMPFIGTRHIYRRQGMCRRLLSAIESALGTLKVKKLIIPAIAEHMHTWTENFNFSPLEESHKQEMKSMNMLVFPGTDMLQKLLVKQEIKEESIPENSDLQSTEAKENSLMLPMLGVKSEMGSSLEHDLQKSNTIGLQHSTECNNNANASGSASQSPTVPSNDIHATSSSLIFSGEPKSETAMNETLAIDSTSVDNLAESAIILKSSSPSENPGTLVAGNSVLDLMMPTVGVKSELGSSLEHDCHMSNSNRLQSLTECSNKADASVSALQSPDVPSDDATTTLISSGEPKHETVMDETLAIDSISVNNLSESAVILRFSSPLENPGTLVADHSVLDPMLVMVGEKSELVSSLEHDNHMSNSIGLQPLTECSSKDSASVSASQSPTVPSKDIPATSSSLIYSSEQYETAMDETLAIDSVSVNNLAESAVNLKSLSSSKGSSATRVAENSVLDPVLQMLSVTSELDSSPEKDPHMSDNSGLRPSTEGSNNAVASVSASESPTVPSNDIPATSNSLIYYCEPKHETAMDGTLAINSTSVINLAKSTVNLKCLSPSKENPGTSVPENIVLGPSTQSSVNCVNDALEGNIKAASVELVLDSLCETSASHIEKDATMIQNFVDVHDSVSAGTCEDIHIGSDISNHTAVDFNNTCEVDVNNTSVDPPKESVECLSAKNAVNENLTPTGTITELSGCDLAGDTHEVTERVDCLEPVTDSSKVTFTEKNTSQSIIADQTESISATDVVGDGSNGDLENEKMQKLDNIQKVDMEVEPIVDSLAETSVQNYTCQALDENLTGSTSNESTKDVKSDSSHQTSVDMSSDLHVPTEIASNAVTYTE